jgi:NAD+-dependent secondary alcohol dehydrogenase Adh1
VLGDEADVADAVREATNGVGADVVLDFVGTDATHESAMQMLARRGLYSIVGYGGTVAHPSVGFVVGETVVAGNLVGNWIDLWKPSSSMSGARSRFAPRRIRSRR